VNSDLVGFLNVVTDGGVHAWLQDVVVEPEKQGLGIGETMVDLDNGTPPQPDLPRLVTLSD